jgi:hypothetical protein
MVCNCWRSAARRPARVWSESLPMRLATRDRKTRLDTLWTRDAQLLEEKGKAVLTYHVGSVSCLLRSVLRMLREVDSCCRRCRNWSSARMFSCGSDIVPTKYLSKSWGGEVGGQCVWVLFRNSLSECWKLERPKPPMVCAWLLHVNERQAGR